MDSSSCELWCDERLMQPEIHRHYRRCYLGGGPLADRRCKLVMAVCNAGSHTGAGWMFRLLCLLFIGLALWAIWQDVKSQTRVDRIIAQRNKIDKGVRRDE